MSDDSIFNEVSEELRSERMRNMWRRYGPFVIGAAVLIVLLVAVNEGWRWYQDSVAAESSRQFYSAFELADGGDLPAAQEQLNQLIAEGSGKYPVLGQFAQAALLARDGNTDEALAAYDAIATTQSEQRLRDLAFLLAGNVLVDTGDVAAVEARIGGLISPDNAMRNAAREILGLTQYAAGEGDAARVTFRAIFEDNQASIEQLQRIQVFDAQLEAEGAADPAPAETAEDTDAAE